MMSVIVLMVTMYISETGRIQCISHRSAAAYAFPLALNVSSARLILLNGNSGTGAAGSVIEAFGNFVVDGNYVIGAVIFLILIAIQYVVINHGAVRISEVIGALYARCHARQTDVDRCRDERRADRRSGSPAPPQATGGGSRILWIHGWRVAFHATRRRGKHPDHQHQHYRRLSDRRVAARHGTAKGAEDLYRSDHRRRLVTVIPGSDDLRFRRPDCHARQFRRPRGRGIPETTLRQSRTADAFGRSAGDFGVFPGLPTIPFLLLGGGLGTVAWFKRKKDDSSVKNLAIAAAAAAQGRPGIAAAGGTAGD